MTGVLETAAVGAVIATASTSLAAAGYGHARGGRTKLLTDAMSSAESGPLSQLPMNSVSKGPLKVENVALSINCRPPVKVSVQFNGEILSITKGDGTADPCMALGGTTVVVEGTKVTATATDVSSSASLTFDSKDQAAQWGKEMQEASRMCDHAHRIQELINCVMKLENYMNKDLRPRAAMCKTREVEIKALERKLKTYEEEEKGEKKKEGGVREEGGREEASNEGSRGDELDCSPGNVKKLMEELQAMKSDCPGAVDDNILSPQIHKMIVERLDTAEAKKAEVDALVHQLMGRIDLLGSDGTAFHDGFTSKKAVLEAEALSLQEKLSMMTFPLDSYKMHQKLEDHALRLEDRLVDVEGTKEQLHNHYKLHGKAEDLEGRLASLELASRSAQVDLEGKAAVDKLLDDRSKRQQDLIETADDLTRRLSTIETNTPRVNGEGVAPQVVQVPQIEYVERVVQVPQIEYVEKIVEKYIERAEAERPANWVSAESYAALQTECEAYKKAVEAGVSLEDHETLMQQHMTLRQQYADQQEDAQCREADNETLRMQMQDLQNQAPAAQQAEAESARADELAAALNEMNAQLADVTNAKAMLEQDLQEKHLQLEEQINRGMLLEQDLQQADARTAEITQLRSSEQTQWDQEFRATIAEKELEIEALRAQEAGAGEEVLNEMRSMNDSLQRQLNNMEALKENAENKAAQQEQERNILGAQLQEDARRLDESRQHLEHITQEYNKVVVENETLKLEASSNSSQATLEAEYLSRSSALEQQMLAEREGHLQELKAMEDKQDMLTKEFEAEYADIRRKQSQTVKQYEEEAQRADIEARAKIQLMEEKQALLSELEQLRLQGLQQQNSAASSTQLQQRLQVVQEDCIRAEAARQSAENQLRESNDREQQLSLKLRLFAEREQQLTLQEQALNRQNEEQRTDQAGVAQRLQAAESKAAEYYQQVISFSAENEQLKAEQGYLVKELESKMSEAPRKDAGDLSAVVTKLSGENSDLKNQLAATWAKINEQTKKIEEERLAFWEELEAVRVKADSAAPVGRQIQPGEVQPQNSSPGNVSVPFEAVAGARMPSSVQPSSSPVTTGFGQQRAGVQRQPPAGVSREVQRNEVLRPVRASGSGAAAGTGPRTVPTRTGGSPAEQPRTAFSPQMSSTSRPGGVPLGSSIGGMRQDAYSQPISTGQVAPSRR